MAPKNRVAPRSLRVSTGNSEEDHGDLMNAVTTLDSSITRIALLYSSDGSLSSHVLELADHLNGTYPNLPDDTKLYWLECIRDASEEFLSVLEQNGTMPFSDFSMAVQNLSSALPAYE